jgi:biotin carboxyl carrier protein
MTFEIEVNGRMRTVGVEPIPGTPSRYRITIDGAEQLVDAREVDHSTLSLIMLNAGGACHEVEMADGSEQGELLVRTRDGLLRAVVNGRRRRRGGAAGAVADGEQRILAPMPGKVVKVLVAPGDEVKARQGILVVEAMKMENEIGSPRAGRIKEIPVKEGMSVEAGRVLAIVE